MAGIITNPSTPSVDNSTINYNGSGQLEIANGGVTATQIASGTITSTQISGSAGITGSQLVSAPVFNGFPEADGGLFGLLPAQGSGIQIAWGIINSAGTILNGNGAIDSTFWSGALLSVTVSNAPFGTAMGLVNNLTTNGLAFQSSSTRNTVTFNTGSGHADTLAVIIFCTT